MPLDAIDWGQMVMYGHVAINCHSLNSFLCYALLVWEVRFMEPETLAGNGTLVAAKAPLPSPFLSPLGPVKVIKSS